MHLALRQLRKARGYSQSYIAERINRDRSLISHYESGTVNVPSNVLVALAALFEVSIDELFIKDTQCSQKAPSMEA